jgi:hypothetical protein
MTNYIMPKRKTPDTPKLKEVTEPTFGETTTKAPTRADIRRASADESGINVAIETFAELNDVLYTADISEVKPLNALEIDTIAAELLAVRKAKDIVEGRESALKKYTTEVIDLKISMNGDDPSSNSGYLVSPENGIKLSKEVSGGKLTVDVDLLEQVLDEEQFRSVVNLVETQITTTRPDGSKLIEANKVYELNEEALEKELKLGNIGMEQVVKATTPGKVRSAFYVRTL